MSKHLDDDLSNAAEKQNLTRPEIKYVAKRVLKALKVLHEDGYVHSGIRKTSRVLIEALLQISNPTISLQSTGKEIFAS